MAISQNISALSTPPSRSDPTNFDSRADTFLGQLPQLVTQLNAWANQANSTESSINSSAAIADTGRASAQAATAAAAGIDDALETISGETASVVAHDADTNAHPVAQARLIGQLGYAIDLLGQAHKEIERVETERTAATTSNDTEIDALETALEADVQTRAYLLDLIALCARMISGGKIHLAGGSASAPAIMIGDAAVYQSATDTLSVAVAGVERLRVTTSGVTVYGTLTES